MEHDTEAQSDAQIIFDRIDRLLGLQPAVDGVPFNTVNPPISELANGTQERRDAFVDDLIRQWTRAQAEQEPSEMFLPQLAVR
jgi:hypothetical protein